MTQYELVGGPHCGATITVPNRNQPITVWVTGAPKAYGASYRLEYTNHPALATDVAYTWNADHDRYAYAGPYEVA